MDRREHLPSRHLGCDGQPLAKAFPTLHAPRRPYAIDQWVRLNWTLGMGSPPMDTTQEPRPLQSAVWDMTDVAYSTKLKDHYLINLLTFISAPEVRTTKLLA